MEGVAGRIMDPNSRRVRPEEFRGISVRSPKALAFLGQRNPLVSDDGRAALVFVNLPHNFITTRSARMVDHIHDVVDESNMPSGLSVAVTGSAGYGRDYALANERSHQKTMLVTLAAVIVILLLVYRAPGAALIPLAAISLAAFVALSLLAVGLNVGLHSGTAERIFVFVLLYGAGVDYSLLFLSRYREFLDGGAAPTEAIVRGVNASAVAVLSSALTTSAGLAMLCFTRFVIFRHTGPAVVMALVTAAVASVTLVPALTVIIGPRAFWPGRKRKRGQEPFPLALAPELGSPGQSDGDEPRENRGEKVPDPFFWPALARFVVGRPALVLGVVLAALLVPAVRGTHLTWVYDSQAGLKPTYDAIRGTQMAQRHWPIGEIAPVTVLVVAQEPLSLNQWSTACGKMLAGIRGVSDVDNARGLTLPLGSNVGPLDNLAALLGPRRSQVQAEYLSPDRRAMRLTAVLRIPPLSLAAMGRVNDIRAAAVNALDRAEVKARVYVAGTTADMADLRTVTQSDFYRLAGLGLGVILVIVVALLRDVILSVFMVAATVLSYLATLGLTYWVFAALGQGGLDWKVEVFLFVVMVAVGQDYNIFFAVRLAQEARRWPARQATERALVHTGPVISSCGLIMAATLGSVMVGDITLLVQLGFAFALGMLIDTFVVRPLLLPAFIVLTRRTLKKAVAFVG